MRWKFPEEAGRLVINTGTKSNDLVRSAAGARFEVHDSASANHLADIQTLDGFSIPYSVIVTDTASFLPIFLGPEDLTTLYLRPVGGGVVVPIFARPLERLDALEQRVAVVEANGGGQGGGGSGVSVVWPVAQSSATWTINHNLGTFPSVTTVDSGGIEVEGAVEYPDSNTIIVRFSAPFAGTAYLN